MSAEKYTSNISTTINKEVHSLLCLVVYELENMKSCKLVKEREKKSQILLLTPDELNIDTIWNKLNIDDSFLVSKVITSIQVIDKDITITNTGTADDYENYNVNVDNNVSTTVTNTVETTVTNKPSVSLDEPIDVRVTNMP